MKCTVGDTFILASKVVKVVRFLVIQSVTLDKCKDFCKFLNELIDISKLFVVSMILLV